jgi:hypothetical protein
MAVFFRAVVMLAVLVGLPAAWIYYGPLPPGAQRAVDRVVEVVRDTMGWQQPTTDASVPKAAPRYNVAAAESPKISTPTANLPPTPLQAMPTSTGLAEQVKPLLEELRALGSTEYSLEPWGPEGAFFRFCCAMPLVAQDKHFTQQFEAVAETPRASIEQVVGEVTRWKTSH